MNDAQIWTLIGGFFAILLAMIGLTLRTVKAELAAKIDPLIVKVDHLDRDVQALVTKFMGSP